MTIAREAVEGAVLRGMASANARYEEWSGGSWVTDYGVEGFMVARIAAALRKEQDDGESLLVEAPFDEIRDCSQAKRKRGRPRKVLQGSRRADIALFDRRGRSVHVIEVKRGWVRNRCFNDIERLLGLLDACARERHGSLKHGFLALPIVEWAETWGEARADVEARASSIEEDVRESFGTRGRKLRSCLGRMRRYPEYYGADEEWAAAGFCMTFSN